MLTASQTHTLSPAIESCQSSATELHFTLAAADQAIFTAFLIENSTVAANLTIATATGSTIVPVYIDGEWPPLCASILYYNHLNSESIPATCGAYNTSMCPMAWSFCRLERCRRGGVWVGMPSYRATHTNSMLLFRGRNMLDADGEQLRAGRDLLRLAINLLSS